jgi:hypothetical protein
MSTMGADTMGWDDSEALIGAFANAMRGRFGHGGRQSHHQRGGGYPQQVPRVGNVFTRPPLPAHPEHPNAMLRSFVGMGFATWTGTDVADKVLSIEPQEKFRGERMVIDVLATSGAAGIVLVRLLQVGVQPQQPDTEQPAPASMFARDVTYSHLDLQVARPGIKMTLTLAVTAAPGSGETITAAVGFYGEWIR